MIETTLVLIKPDAVAARLVGTLIAEYERAGLHMEAMQFCHPSRSFYEIHYAEHAGKAFLPELLAFMEEGPVVALVLQGEGAIEQVRSINGATNPSEAAPTSIRGRFGTTKQRNCVHGSAHGADAQREVALWFPQLHTVE